MSRTQAPSARVAAILAGERVFATDVETLGQFVGRNPVVAIGWCARAR